MTSQPRDLAAEAQTLIALRAKGYIPSDLGAAFQTLFDHIAELERELEEATQAGIDTAREVSDTLSGRIDELEAERDGLREAVRWALENGAYYFNGTLFTETDQHPPTRLAPILAEAMRSKT